MTDLRTRLADAVMDGVGADEHDAYQVVDVLLSLPGIAVVDREDPETLERVYRAIWDENGRNYDDEGNFIEIGVVERHRNMARAALLAVANAVESATQ